MIFDRLKKIIGRDYHPLNRIEIDKAKLIANYDFFSKINSHVKVAPVLKSNAYGLGLKEVALILDPLKPPLFCVDSLYEAYKLKNLKVKTKILIMGYVDPINLKLKKLPFSYVVFSRQQLSQILAYQPHAEIHLFVDTGMHREGILVSQLDRFVKTIPSQFKKNIVGLMSHLGQSENPLSLKTQKQISEFEKSIKILNNQKIFPRWIHLGNSGALLNNDKLKISKICNLNRVGIGLYENVFRLITHIVQIKNIKKADKVGYSFTYEAKKDLKIAILPIGYNDGVDRGLSNKGHVIINKIACPIIGRVSMNITTIDVSRVKNIKVGDEAEIILTTKIPGKIFYEILVHLNQAIKRVVV